MNGYISTLCVSGDVKVPLPPSRDVPSASNTVAELQRLPSAELQRLQAFSPRRLPHFRPLPLEVDTVGYHSAMLPLVTQRWLIIDVFK